MYKYQLTGIAEACQVQVYKEYRSASRYQSLHSRTVIIMSQVLSTAGVGNNMPCTIGNMSSDNIQVSTCQVINKASVSIVYIELSNNTIRKNGTDTRDQYEYKKIIQFQKNSLSKDCKLFTTIKKE